MIEWKNRFIVDFEANALLEKATKIHCLSIGTVNKEGKFVVSSTVDYNIMRKFLLNKDNILIGHNITLYDILLAEKLLNIKIECKIEDTLGMSWYIEPIRQKHSLESYAVDYGDNKKEIEDWENLSSQEYIERCEKDVQLQYQLYYNQITKLFTLYDGDQEQVKRIINYINFKLDCVREQQYVGLKFDYKLAQKSLDDLNTEKNKKINILIEGMPKTPIKGVRSMPKKMYNSKSELSSLGLKWNEFLKENGLPISHTRDVEFIKGYEEPNPNSHIQIKNWLFGLGWEPENYKFNRDKKTGKISQVPQIGSKEKDGTLCPSVLKLIKKAPAIEALNGLSIINHRITVFEGFIRDQIDGRLYQNIGGLTNTLRLQHRIIVNLPKISVPYGKEIRGSIIADEDMLLCGSDMTNIESMTRNHYMMPFDPEYVNILVNDKNFDSHTDIAVEAKMMTKDEEGFYKWYSKK